MMGPNLRPTRGQQSLKPARDAARLWLGAGWLGFAALPWYFGDTLSPWCSGLALGLTGGRWWLLVLVLPLLVGLVPVLRRGSLLVAIGAAGVTWLLLEGFAIDHRGWAWGWLVDVTGTIGPSQPGLGYGAFLALLAFLMLFCHGLAVRGLCGGDAFTVSALGLVLGATALFVLFPIATVLNSAVEDDA